MNSFLNCLDLNGDGKITLLELSVLTENNRISNDIANRVSFEDDLKKKRSEQKIIALRYLTDCDEFLYAQAIKDYFDLPIMFPKEEVLREFDFSDVLNRIAMVDIRLCIEVWEWCLAQFLPYAEYDISSKAALTNYAVDDFYKLSDEFCVYLLKYMDRHPQFRETVVRYAEEMPFYLHKLIVMAMKEDLFNTAKALFEDGLIVSSAWTLAIELLDEIISHLKNYKEPESLKYIEYIENGFVPLLKSYKSKLQFDELENLEKDMLDYKQTLKNIYE